MPERNDHINETEIRESIGSVLQQLRHDRSLGVETKTGDDNDSIDYHIDNIIKAGGGIWNETVAKDYLKNLRTQVGQEIEAPNTVL